MDSQKNSEFQFALSADEAIDRLADDFEAAWKSGSAPAIEPYLFRCSADALRAKALLALIRVDMEYRLKAGEAARVEGYLARYAELASDPGAVLELVRAEFDLRRLAEPQLEQSEFRNRFPHLPLELAGNSTAPSVHRGKVMLRLNCPHCQNPIQVVDDAGEEEIVATAASKRLSVFQPRGQSTFTCEQNLAATVETLGIDHPDTLRSLHALAVAYRTAGRLDEAVALIKDSMSSPRGARPVRIDEGLVGYWNFDEGTGKTVVDRSGNELAGTLLADDPSKCWSKDTPFTTNNRSSLSLNGGGEHLEVPNQDAFDVDLSYTITAWIKTTAKPVHWERIIDKSIFEGGYAMALSNGEGRILFQAAEDAASIGNHLVAGDPVIDGAWHHVACIYDEKVMRLYLDGGSPRQRSVPMAEPRNNDSPLRIGDGPYSDNSYRGLIDEVRIYRRALNPVEIVWLAWPELQLDSDAAQ